jgi:hypothetical protein
MPQDRSPRGEKSIYRNDRMNDKDRNAVNRAPSDRQHGADHEGGHIDRDARGDHDRMAENMGGGIHHVEQSMDTDRNKQEIVNVPNSRNLPSMTGRQNTSTGSKNDQAGRATEDLHNKDTRGSSAGNTGESTRHRDNRSDRGDISTPEAA